MRLRKTTLALILITLSVPALGQITDARRKARVLYSRLTSVTLPIDAPELIEMERLIASGNIYAATKIATDKDEFYNIVIRNMATQMSNRDLKVTNDFNDFVATFIGNVRDRLNAKELLTGDYIYIGDATQLEPNFPVEWTEFILKSNSHYRALDGFAVPGYTGTFTPSKRANFRKVLKKVKQQVIKRGGGAVDASEPAGLLTTRAWAEAHLNMGTNRRAVQFVLSQFLCRNLEDVVIAGPDARIANDVTRTPQGDPAKFSECRGCHTILDYMRPAFLNFDFLDLDNQRFLKSTRDLYVESDNVTENGDRIRKVNGLYIPAKYFSNETVASQAERNANPDRTVRSDAWENNLTNAASQAAFGWRGPMSGNGLRSFASMIANARAFSGCLVDRVFKSVCGRPLDATSEDALKQALIDNFESNNYRIKGLFEQVAARPECLGN